MSEFAVIDIASGRVRSEHATQDAALAARQKVFRPSRNSAYVAKRLRVSEWEPHWFPPATMQDSLRSRRALTVVPAHMAYLERVGAGQPGRGLLRMLSRFYDATDPYKVAYFHPAPLDSWIKFREKPAAEILSYLEHTTEFSVPARYATLLNVLGDGSRSNGVFWLLDHVLNAM